LGAITAPAALAPRSPSAPEKWRRVIGADDRDEIIGMSPLLVRDPIQSESPREFPLTTSSASPRHRFVISCLESVSKTQQSCFQFFHVDEDQMRSLRFCDGEPEVVGIPEMGNQSQ
jgi:hypothetical protein